PVPIEAPPEREPVPAEEPTDPVPAEGPTEPESQFDPPEEPVEDEPEDEPMLEPTKPPRFDGPYVGTLVMGTADFAHVKDLATPNPMFGTGGFLQAGDAVFPWMSIGIAVGGHAGWIGKQQIFQGALLLEFGFVPAKKYPLSIR